MLTLFRLPHIGDFEDSISAADDDYLVELENGKSLCSCGVQLNNIALGRRHIRDVHGPNKNVQCSICKKFYKNERTRNNHAYNQHGLKVDQLRSIADGQKMFH